MAKIDNYCSLLTTNKQIYGIFLMRITIVAVICLAISGSPSIQQEEPSERMYKGCQLFEVFPERDAQLEALVAFVGENEGVGRSRIELWRIGGIQLENSSSSSSSDVLVCPEAVSAFREFLRAQHIPSKTLSEDISKGMTSGRDERPPPPSNDGVQYVHDWDYFEEGWKRADRRLDLGRYYSYEKIRAYAITKARKHPHFVRALSLGNSFEGREIPMLKIGFPPSGENPKKPVMFVDAGIHAREWIAPAVALYLIDQLVGNTSLSPLLHQIDVYIVPVLNPDGYEFSRAQYRLWRRTRSPRQRPLFKEIHPDVAAAECVGVDANRNFPFHWNESGTQGNPCSPVYPGERPLTEVESLYLAEFLQQEKSRIKAYLTLHSYQNMILYPWGYAKNKYTDDHEQLERVGRAMAAAILAAGGDEYKVDLSSSLYAAAGSSMDFAKSLGINYTYTMELTMGEGFLFPAHRILSTAHQVVQGILVLANEVAKFSESSTVSSTSMPIINLTDKNEYN